MSSILRNQVDDVLGKFAAQAGPEDLRLDEEGSAQFALDETFVSLDLDEAAGQVMLSPVGQPAAAAEIYGRLLDSNLFWSGADGATLARDSTSGTIVLLRQLPVEGLDLQGFEVAREPAMPMQPRGAWGHVGSNGRTRVAMSATAWSTGLRPSTAACASSTITPAARLLSANAG